VNGLEPVAEQSPVELPTARTHLFDPAPELASLRERQPACRLRYPDGHVGWLITSHKLARAVMTDARFSRRPPDGLPIGRFPIGDPKKIAAFFGALVRERVMVANFLELDPPAQTRYRRLVAGHFTVRRVEELRTRIERIVDGQLDAMEQTGPPLDLVQTFALPVAASTQYALLGVPAGDGERFAGLSSAVFDPNVDADRLTGSFWELRDYLRLVAEQKRLNPENDLISDIARRDDLSDEERFSLIVFLFTAGLEPSAGMLALATFALLCHPAALEALRADGSLIESAIDELLRYLTITQAGALTRTALEDVEIGGIVIHAGQSVTVSLAAANRDPEKFDRPDTLELTRSETGHLAFGQGVHMCLGQHIARLELQIGITRLLQRFPNLHLAVALEDVPMVAGDQQSYGVQELLIGW
jgi:cytochrome P450